MKSLSVKLGVILVLGLIVVGYAEAWGVDWIYLGETWDGEYFYDAHRLLSQIRWMNFSWKQYANKWESR